MEVIAEGGFRIINDYNFEKGGWYKKVTSPPTHKFIKQDFIEKR